ncbi:protein rep, partial [Salmonella enterica subsp. enterica serovar Typhimurium]|uniref:protein rep n=1 Tax=Salmonella enterica TaxID=28901 RepID=UPI0014323562
LIAHHAAQREKIRWLFLTLTVENVPKEKLKMTISEMMKAWNLLFRRKAFKTNILGWMRSLEITAEKNRDGYYHPHFHVLLAVRPSYFKKGYIKQKDWSLMWQKSLKADYMPIVHVTTVKDKRNAKREAQILADKAIEITEQGFNELPASQVAEMAKYTVNS